MTHNQCKTCALPANTLKQVNEWLTQGKGGKTISLLLHDQGIQVSERAIRRHKSHATDSQPNTLLGVVQPPQPTGRIEMDDEGGEAQTRPYADEENPSELIKDTAQVLREHGIDPEVFEVVGPVRMSRWQVASFDPVEQEVTPKWYTAYKFRFERKTVSEDGEIDLPTLFMTVKDRVAPKEVDFTIGRSDRALVVSFSDPQIGKVDVRGGTEELIERVLEKKEKLDRHINKTSATSAVFLDGGDIIEGFENTGQQQFTNDLSIMDQIDLAITLEEQFIDTLAQRYLEVEVGGVPSNHANWRRGKDVLGKPSDDWGLFSLKQIERLYGRVGGYDHVGFSYPEPWSKSLVVDVLGHGVGLTHGDEVNRPEGIPDWWAKQVHGGSPLARAEILVSAHFHTLRVQNCGRTPEGIQKWWLQSPTLDNGSSWYANKAGSDSDPGLLVFEIDRETGFDLQSLTIL